MIFQTPLRTFRLNYMRMYDTSLTVSGNDLDKLLSEINTVII